MKLGGRCQGCEALEKVLARRDEELRHERIRVAGLTDRLLQMQREGYRYTEPDAMAQFETPELSADIVAAIQQRARRLDSDIGKQLLTFAQGALASGDGEERVIRQILDGVE